MEQARRVARARLGDVFKGIGAAVARPARRAEADREREKAKLTLAALVDDGAAR